MTKMGFLRDFQGVIGGFLRDFVAIAGFIIFFDYEIAEKSLGYLCTERDFWGVYRGMLGDSRTQKPRAGVAVVLDRGVFRNGFLDVSSVSVGCIPLKMMNNQSVIIM